MTNDHKGYGNELYRLKKIEDDLSSHTTDLSDLKKVAESLREIVKDLDKQSEVRTEKDTHLQYRITKIEEALGNLEAKLEEGTSQNNKKTLDLYKTIMISLFGSVVAYFLGTLKSD